MNAETSTTEKAERITEKVAVTMPDGTTVEVVPVDYTAGEKPVVAVILNSKGTVDLLMASFKETAKREEVA